MTRRERLERKVEKREEWAAKAAARSEARFGAAARVADQIPFGQPILVGHHSEGRARRDAARIHSNMDKAVEEHRLAQHHAEKGAGLARQLETNILDDDPDAIERLEARIAATLAANEKAKAINKAWRKGEANAPTDAPRGEKLAMAAHHVVEAGLLDATEAADMIRRMMLASWLKSPMSTTGASAAMRKDRERIEAIKVRRARTEKADAAPGGVSIEPIGEGGYVRVTFAEKPARAVLEALRAAGFWWGRGSWTGERAKLPAEVGGEKSTG